jgi:hypothetical protein
MASKKEPVPQPEPGSNDESKALEVAPPQDGVEAMTYVIPDESQGISYDGFSLMTYSPANGGLVGAAPPGDNAAGTSQNKDIRIFPNYGATTRDSVSQIDFKMFRNTAGSNADVAYGSSALPTNETKASIISWAVRYGAESFDTPVLAIGGQYNDGTYTWNVLPHTSSSTGSTSTPPSYGSLSTGASARFNVAAIYFHPRSGKIEANYFSGPARAFNGLTLSNDSTGFTVAGGNTLMTAPWLVTGSANYFQHSADVTSSVPTITMAGGLQGGPGVATLAFTGSGNTATLTFNIQGTTATTVYWPSTANVVYPLTYAAASPTFALGDLHYVAGSSFSTLTRLAIGTRSSVLVANSASPIPTWIAPATTGHTLIGSTTADATWGVLGIVGGGTGAATFTTNGVIYGNGTSALQVTAAGTANQVLRIPGAGGAPAFGAIDLSQSAAVTNQLVVGNGGTGASTFTANGVLYGNTTSAVQVTAASGTNYNVLRTVSAGGAPTWGNIDLSQAGSVGATVLGVANGGTNISSSFTAGAVLTGNGSGYTLITIGPTSVTAGISVTSSGSSITVNSNAVSTNTASTLVIRDASARFQAADPSAAQDVATKNYVDATAIGILDVKQSCRVATVTHTDIPFTSISGNTITPTSLVTTIDGVTLAVNDRVLIKNYTGAYTNNTTESAAFNGLYVVNSITVAAGQFTRTLDANTGTELNGGVFTFITSGTVNNGTGWVCTTAGTVTINSTSITWEQMYGVGTIVAGSGLNSSAMTYAANVTLDNSVSNRIRFVGGSGSNNSASAGNAGTAVTFDVTVPSGTQNMTLAGLSTGFTLTGGATPVTLTMSGSTTITGSSTTLTLTGNLTVSTVSTISLNSQTLTMTSSTGNITFAGNNNTLTLSSGGGNITLAGNGNTLTLSSSSVTINGGGNTLAMSGNLTVSTASTLSLNSQTLTLTASTANVTLTPSSTTATTHNIVSNATAQWQLSFTGASFTPAAGSLFYAQSTFSAGMASTGAGTSSQVLIGGSTPSWSSVNLTTMVSNTLPVGNGGTGATTFTSNGVLYGNTTSAVQVTAASGSNYNVLRTVTAGAAPTWGNLDLSQSGSVGATILGLANGGTNANNTAVNGGIAYSTTTAINFSLAGTSGQILRSGGAGTPTWGNIVSSLTAGTAISITGTTNATINVDTTTNITWTGSFTWNPTAGVNFTVQNGSGANRFRIDTTAGYENVRLGIDTATGANHIACPISQGFVSDGTVNAQAVVKLTATGSNTVGMCSAGDEPLLLGVAVTSGATTTGNAITIATHGRVNVAKATGVSIAAGEYVVMSATAGAVTGTGGNTTVPPVGGYIGRSTQAYASGATTMQIILGAASGGSFSGSGTINTVPVFIAGNEIGNSGISQDTATTSPGNIYAQRATNGNVNFVIGNATNTGNGTLVIHTANTAASTTAGVINIPSFTASNLGIAFGTDTFYRYNPSVGNVLQSSIGLGAGTVLGAGLSSGTYQFYVASNGNLTIQPQAGGQASAILLQNFNSADDTSATAVIKFRIRNSGNTSDFFSIDSVGNVSAFSKSFNIEHPTKEGYRLVYGCLEGPEHGAYQRGNANGRGCVRVELPEYWYKLIGSEYTVNATALGNYGVYIKDKDDKGFTVCRTGLFGRFRKFSFEFMAVGSRQDAHLKVEVLADGHL